MPKVAKDGGKKDGSGGQDTCIVEGGRHAARKLAKHKGGEGEDTV